MKMKPRLNNPELQKMYEHIATMIIITWFLLILFFVFGFKDKTEEYIEFTELPEYGYIEFDCACGNHLAGNYIKPYYRFVCLYCDNVKTNTECKTTEEFYELVGFKMYDIEGLPSDCMK